MGCGRLVRVWVKVFAGLLFLGLGSCASAPVAMRNTGHYWTPDPQSRSSPLVYGLPVEVVEIPRQVHVGRLLRITPRKILLLTPRGDSVWIWKERIRCIQADETRETIVPSVYRGPFELLLYGMLFGLPFALPPTGFAGATLIGTGIVWGATMDQVTRPSGEPEVWVFHPVTWHNAWESYKEKRVCREAIERALDHGP